MVINANTGPSVQFGITMTSTGQVTQYNEERGPSVDDLGAGILDPRPQYRYQPGNAVGSNIAAFWNNECYVDYVPAALSSNAFVSNSVPVASTSITLTSTGAGVIVTTFLPPEGGPAVTVTAIDSTAALIEYGSAGSIGAWNPRFGTGRNITISLSSNLDGGSFSVAGRDMYGYKMTETIAAGSTNIKGVKAFKYISAVAASSTITSTGVIVGYGDVFGFPAFVPYVGLNTLVSISTAPTSFVLPVTLTASNTVLASTVATQTSTTPDVRGTFIPATASGTQRLQVYNGFDAFIMGTIGTGVTGTSSAMLGAAQFSSV